MCLQNSPMGQFWAGVKTNSTFWPFKKAFLHITIHVLAYGLILPAFSQISRQTHVRLLLRNFQELPALLERRLSQQIDHFTKQTKGS
jgi:hypothetical protein